MFVATHTVIGALIGAALPTHPALAFLFAFFVHFLTDMVPHGDSQLYKDHMAGSRKTLARLYVLGDVLLAIGIIGFLLYHSILQAQPTIAIGIFGSVLPDILVGLYEVFPAKWLARFHKIHFFFHNLVTGRTGDLPLPVGMGMELILMSILFIRFL